MDCVIICSELKVDISCNLLPPYFFYCTEHNDGMLSAFKNYVMSLKLESSAPPFLIQNHFFSYKFGIKIDNDDKIHTK